MGEIADAIINGLYCQYCGDVIDGDEPGYPRNCDSCTEPTKNQRDQNIEKTMHFLCKMNRRTNKEAKQIIYEYDRLTVDMPFKYDIADACKFIQEDWNSFRTWYQKLRPLQLKIKNILSKNKYVVTKEEIINYGVQLHTASGAVINLFTTGRVLVQGKADDTLKNLLK